ncbi:MAG: hypothetical protein KAS07_06035 [Candidatus Pacebacteria bacterium]|nr:hypothetical protein [Candidatus Paceibacterota bacterium]
MTTRIWKGSTIIGLANRNEMLTKNISAKSAVAAIVNKLGSIDRNGDYYHRANNVWSKYSPGLDSKILAERKGRRYTLSNAHKGDSGKKTEAGYL